MKIKKEDIPPIKSFEESLRFLQESINVLEEFLNAGCKESRKKSAKKAKKIYKEYHCEEYKNKNEKNNQ